MQNQERNKEILKKYIPAQAVEVIAGWITLYRFKLKVKKPRSSRRGDYTAPHSGKNHVITINRDLNPYAFLITLVHEVAHLVTWEKYKGKVNPHGKEWKDEYAQLLQFFLSMPSEEGESGMLLPSDLLFVLKEHACSPSAASCTDLQLSRVLAKYDAPSQTILLERMHAGASFRIAESGRRMQEGVFIKGEKRRTRFKCTHSQTRREYLVHALCKVVPA